MLLYWSVRSESKKNRYIQAMECKCVFCYFQLNYIKIECNLGTRLSRCV